LTLANWLAWKARLPNPYRNFDLIEIEEKNEIDHKIEPFLTKLLQEYRFDPNLFQKLASRLGWSNVEKIILNSTLPTVQTARRGYFGEVLTSAMLSEFFGYVIPIKKLRYAISANQSLPGTDVIAIKKQAGAISEVCFVESKLRTTSDTTASVQGYRQLKEDYSQRIPDMILFVLSRLYENEDPLFEDFFKYVSTRKDMSGIERFCLGLTWEHGTWTETVLKNLEEETDDPSFPRLVVHRTRIKNLAEHLKELFKAIGVTGASEDD